MVKIEAIAAEKSGPDQQYKNADDALESMSMKLAERQFKNNMYKGIENKDSEDEVKEKKKKKQTEEKIKKAVLNSDFDAEEKKAIEKINLGETHQQSFKEYQIKQIEEQMAEEEIKKKEVPKVIKKKPLFKKKAQKSTLESINKITAKAKKIEKSEEVEDNSAVQQITDIHMGKLDISKLIKNAVKHQKKPEEENAGLSQFAPKIEEEAPAPAAPAVKKLSSKQQEKIQEKLNQKLKETGENPPSDITQALADSQDFGDVGTSQEPTGFFGKYLKKHRDMK